MPKPPAARRQSNFWPRAAVAALEEKSRLLMEAERIGHMGGWELDVVSGRMIWTPELCRLLGFKKANAFRSLEQSFASYSLASRKVVREAFDAALKRGVAYDLELEMKTRDARTIWVREVCRPTLHRGKVVSIVGVTQDITELRTMATLLSTAMDAERARIGADLHDGLGQELTALALMIGAAAGSAMDRKALTVELRRLGRLASGCIESVRNIGHALLPVELRTIGFKGACRQLGALIRRAFGTAVVIRIRGSSRDIPDGAAAEHLYRIIQESITNAIKHGKAGRIGVSVVCDSRNLRLRIADDGRGFDPAKTPRGAGLQIMRYRARLLGGHFEIESPPDGGTVIKCLFPQSRRERRARSVSARA